jgi:hypothetical protein
VWQGGQRGNGFVGYNLDRHPSLPLHPWPIRICSAAKDIRSMFMCEIVEANSQYLRNTKILCGNMGTRSIKYTWLQLVEIFLEA